MVVHAVEDARLLEGSDPGVVRVAGRLVVSKGTYVRSLAVHLGQRLGVPAHLQSLRRTACGRVGLGHPGTRAPLVAMVLEPGEPGEPGGRARPPRFRVRPASLPEAGRDEQAAYLRAGALDPLEALDLPLARSTAEAAVLLRQGAPVAASAIEGASEGVCAVVLPDRCLVVGRVSEGCFAPDRLVRLGPLPPHGAA
jgi:tRNA U55 pseudouridine synthase TruB